ncbi:lipopolysaccharide assembly protein LapB [Flavobacterium sp. H122]|uniref:tetratricopeptide repeat protein n=1 Tax=Flavobacterium sp. H122 TaxID=2529860 RepID=UPI0010A9E6F5|nr:tetratricopeptide repeat protein [Flavobacterium sp. H122]
MIKKALKISFLLVLIFSTQFSIAQTNPEDIALDSDAFQEAYYESLKQKGIENYDKAIIELEKCLQLQPQNAVVFHELGKNYFFKKDYVQAEEAYTKATQIDPINKWYWIDLYEVYYETKNFNQGILTLQKIIPLDKKYKEDLVSLYMYTRQYDKALLLINELDETEGKTERRNQYRAEINKQTGLSAGNKNDLEKAIDENPLNEENYLSLIAKYSESNQEEKARQVLEKLQKNIPGSDWAQVFLFKYYINDGKGQEASKALETVLKSRKVDKKIKFKMFNEFLIFASKNPAFENQLASAAKYFEGDPEVDVYKEIGKFYYKKQNWDLAIKNLEKSVAVKNSDVEANIFLLASYEEKADFQNMQKVASDLIDMYPNQPEYYFFAGKSAFQLKNVKKANEFLEIGLDYVVDNTGLEIDFLNLMSQVASALGNGKKAEEYSTRAANLKNKKK